jgi:hypothetical protein
MSAASAKGAAQAALKNYPKAGKMAAQKGPKRRSPGPEDPPRNVGAVPARPNNIGATPPDRPKNVGAVKPTNNIGATPPDGSKNIGATPPGPWDDVSEGDSYPYTTYEGNTPWLQWLRSWDAGKAKRQTSRIIAPDRATIAGHTFDLEHMPRELRKEMYSAISNSTRFQDLTRGLLDFEIVEG